MQTRSAGVLLHPSSLPNDAGIGTLGSEARQFVDSIAECGFRWWQILPLVPSAKHGNPYSSWSTFASNPLLIDLKELHESGLLDEAAPVVPMTQYVDFEATEDTKSPLLAQAAQRFLNSDEHPWHEDFRLFEAQADWLEDAALFYAIREHHKRKPWWQWSSEFSQRNSEALESAKAEHQTVINQFKAIQFFFERQWTNLRAYAEQKKVRFIGDIPIYVDHDSVDVWANQSLFRLDDNGLPTKVSGAPPDAYSAVGQLWENPLYHWENLCKNGFGWWLQRIDRVLSQVDLVRLDHFRGFAAYWSVPYGEANAVHGQWERGPGEQLFDCIEKRWPKMPFIAEDLGLITQDVYALRDQYGLPGMRVLQFGFDGKTGNLHNPQHEDKNSIIYTGTHDCDTALGWWQSASPETKKIVQSHFTTQDEALVWDLIANALASRSPLAIFPVQDLLTLGTEARMNRPGTTENNWRWRLQSPEPLSNLRERIRQLLEVNQRCSED